MYGIAGYYRQPDGQKLADVMSDRIAHRGPDPTGTRCLSDDRVSVQLGFRQLEMWQRNGPSP
jgi:asparagine synthase (glutamine-hydrolysing)